MELSPSSPSTLFLLLATAGHFLFLPSALAEVVCDDLSSIGVERVVTPSDGDSYEESRKQFASNLGSQALSDTMLSPDAVVYPANDDDLVKIVKFAASCGYRLSIRSGGHQFAGHSSCKAGGDGPAKKCIQVDMSAFDSIYLMEGNDNVVTVGSGVLLEDFAPALQELGLMVPMGHCNKVGVGGHFQTSAAGMFARGFGLGLDYVKSFRIVTAADADATGDGGTVRTVSRESDAGLYNAVLGGGPGSFGIVVDYTVEAIKSADHPHSHMFYYFWPMTNTTFEDVATLYQEMMSDPALERDMFLYLTVGVPPAVLEGGGIDPHVISLVGVWSGVDNGNLTEPANKQAYIDPWFFNGTEGMEPTVVFDMPASLDVIQNTMLFAFNHSDNRYFQHTVTSSMISDTEYFAMANDFILKLDSMDGVYVSYDFAPYGGSPGGQGSQYNRNVGLNGFPTRTMRTNNDIWIFFDDEAKADMLEGELKSFLERTADTEYVKSRPGVDGMWYSTQSIHADEAVLKTNYATYYSNATMFEDLQTVKMRVDPNDVFNSDMTVPLPPKDETGDGDGDGDPMTDTNGSHDSGDASGASLAAVVSLSWRSAAFLVALLAGAVVG